MENWIFSFTYLYAEHHKLYRDIPIATPIFLEFLSQYIDSSKHNIVTKA